MNDQITTRAAKSHSWLPCLPAEPARRGEAGRFASLPRSRPGSRSLGTGFGTNRPIQKLESTPTHRKQTPASRSNRPIFGNSLAPSLTRRPAPSATTGNGSEVWTVVADYVRIPAAEDGLVGVRGVRISFAAVLLHGQPRSG